MTRSASGLRRQAQTDPVTPSGRYMPARAENDFIFTAGMTPRRHGKLAATGQVGTDFSASEGRSFAYQATARALAAARQATGPERHVVSVVSLTVYIAAPPTFTELSDVADAASECIQDSLPDAPLPARAAIGVAVLPGGAPVEVQLIAQAQGLYGGGPD